MDAKKGDMTGGADELLELAGEGGMATVWRAVMHGAAGFTRPVAVKKIKSEFRAIKNYIDMFVEEARVGSELAHPNIVQVHDFLTDASSSYYLIMEWVEGVDLGSFVRSYVRGTTPTPWPVVVAIGIGTLRGLAAAHGRRRGDGSLAAVIHRDVSPHNIMLGANGIVKLTDFGLARARDRVYSLTAPGTGKGKLSYLSPEVSTGKQATPLSDVFSVGTCLWEALSGRRLFDAQSDLEVFKQIRNCEVRALAPLRPDLPPRLIAAVHKALSKEPADRFGSARLMAMELAGVLSSAEPGDLQAELGRSVVEAKRRLTAATRVSAQDDEPTWTFDVDFSNPQISRQSVEIEFSSTGRHAGDSTASGADPKSEPAIIIDRKRDS